MIALSAIAYTLLSGQAVSPADTISTPVPAATTVVVTGDRNPHRSGATSTSFSRDDLSALPSAGQPKAVEEMLLRVPGVVPDEDGRLHAHGEDAALQYMIDGIPVTANRTRVFSSLVPMGSMEEVHVLTGLLPAEHGLASAAIVEAQTLEVPAQGWTGRLSGGVGSFGQLDGAGSVGFHLGSKASLALAGSSSVTDRYLDPISGFDPIHDHGRDQGWLSRLDLNPVDSWTLHVLGMGSQTLFQIPNQRADAQDQKQNVGSLLSGISSDWKITPARSLQTSFWMDRSWARMRSGGLADILSTQDSLKALENERFFFGADRTQETYGTRWKLTETIQSGSVDHEIGIGAQAEWTPLDERLVFAVTDLKQSDTASGMGDVRLLPYDLTRAGGKPLRVKEYREAHSQSAWFQDQITTGRWTISPGLRVDRFDLFKDELFFSPRLAIVYGITPDIDLKFGYDRIVQRAPYENLLVSSSASILPLVGGEQGGIPLTVQPEKEHVAFLGGTYRRKGLIVDLDGYAKWVENFLVKVELGNSGMIFPANLAEGAVGGVDLRAAYTGIDHLRVVWTGSLCASMGHRPSDGSNPLAAGLVLGEEGHQYSHPWGKEDFFWTEHNQLATSTLETQYQFAPAWELVLGGRFDSGLPFDLVDPKTGDGPDEQTARQILRNRGYADDVLDLLDLAPEEPGSPDRFGAPHAIFHAGLGLRIPLANVDATWRIEARNLFDTPYLTKFESSIGGTHFGEPRTFQTRVELRI